MNRSPPFPDPRLDFTCLALQAGHTGSYYWHPPVNQTASWKKDQFPLLHFLIITLSRPQTIIWICHALFVLPLNCISHERLRVREEQEAGGGGGGRRRRQEEPRWVDLWLRSDSIYRLWLLILIQKVFWLALVGLSREFRQKTLNVREEDEGGGGRRGGGTEDDSQSSVSLCLDQRKFTHRINIWLNDIFIVHIFYICNDWLSFRVWLFLTVSLTLQNAALNPYRASTNRSQQVVKMLLSF